MTGILLIVAVAVGSGFFLVLFSLCITYLINQKYPPPGKCVNVDGQRIHYIEHGSGTPIVMIHGLGGTHRHFAYLNMEELARSHRVFALDRPGSGDSTRARGASASIIEQAVVVLEFMDQIGLDRAILVGHSMGASVALAAAILSPSQIKGLALIAPLTRTDIAPTAVSSSLSMRYAILRLAYAYTIALPARMLKGSSLMALAFLPDAVPDDFTTKGGGILGLRPRSFYATSLDYASLGDGIEVVMGHYASLNVPIHVLHGRHDTVLDWKAHSQYLKDSACGVTLKLVDGGHMLPMTEPELTTNWLLEVASKST